jgi:hypothetical protein
VNSNATSVRHTFSHVTMPFDHVTVSFDLVTVLFDFASATGQYSYNGARRSRHDARVMVLFGCINLPSVCICQYELDYKLDHVSTSWTTSARWGYVSTVWTMSARVGLRQHDGAMSALFGPCQHELDYVTS